MKLHQKILKFLDPKGEACRQDFRMCLAQTSAHAEDVDRTISMNGFDFKRLMRENGIKVKEKA